jgi:hypothetical protein
LEKCVGSRVHLVGVSISFEKNFYRLAFTPPLSGSPYRSIKGRTTGYRATLRRGGFSPFTSSGGGWGTSSGSVGGGGGTSLGSAGGGGGTSSLPCFLDGSLDAMRLL